MLCMGMRCRVAIGDGDNALRTLVTALVEGATPDGAGRKGPRGLIARLTRDGTVRAVEWGGVVHRNKVL